MHNAKPVNAISNKGRGNPPLYITWIIGLLIATDVNAVEYTFQADANVEEEYNTNIFLTPGPHTDVWGTKLGLNTQFSAAEEIWKLDGSIRLDNYFYDQKGLNTLNQFVSLTGSYFVTERSQFALRGDYIRDSSRTSFIETNDLVFEQVRRNRQTINPSWTYYLSEDTRLGLNYQYDNTEYRNKDNTAFPHYQIHFGSVGVVHEYSEYLKMNGSFSYTSYSAPESTTFIPGTLDFQIFRVPGTYENRTEEIMIDYATAIVGFSYSIDETFDVSLAAGGQYNKTEAGSRTIFRTAFGDPILDDAEHISSSSLTYLIDARATKRFEVDELNLDYAHTVSPNIYGNLIEADTVTLTGKHKFTPTLTGSAQFSYTDRKTADQRNVELNRQLFRARSELIWNWSENWSVIASYQYSRQEIDVISNIPESHAAYLTIRYRWDKLQY
ncbi:hypothetical protein [Methylocaldum sp. 14B]|uniref:hypothetical protein n=1 Tax=unclassified Methylocaldum TaxID=2622260 RepID=UPI001180F15C|nr:hypothetical protein [Methylocaldum sp. 14B]